MELCCPSRPLSSSLPHRTPFTPSPNSSLPLLPRSFSSFSSPKALAFKPASRGLRARASEETSTVVVSEPLERTSNEAVSNEIEETPDDGTSTEEIPGENVAVDFLNKIDLKLDSGGSYSILLFGAGALLSLWVSSAVVGALDSVPLIPKLMEVVGLAYTIWFSYRYLIFKQNRDELFAKIDDIKEQIVGSDDN